MSVSIEALLTVFSTWSDGCTLRHSRPRRPVLTSWISVLRDMLISNFLENIQWWLLACYFSKYWESRGTNLIFYASRDIALHFPQWVHSYEKATLPGYGQWGFTEFSVKSGVRPYNAGHQSATPAQPPAVNNCQVWGCSTSLAWKLGPEELTWRSAASTDIVSREGTRKGQSRATQAHGVLLWSLPLKVRNCLSHLAKG